MLKQLKFPEFVKLNVIIHKAGLRQNIKKIESNVSKSIIQFCVHARAQILTHIPPDTHIFTQSTSFIAK